VFLPGNANLPIGSRFAPQIDIIEWFGATRKQITAVLHFAARSLEVESKKKKLSPEALEFFRAVGRKGGLARAKKHSAEKRKKWGKLGGHPPWTKEQRKAHSELTTQIWERRKKAQNTAKKRLTTGR
jgi:hypothetical protein